MTQRPLPPFLSFASEDTLAGPFEFRRMRARGFVLEGHRDAMQKTIDRGLNEAADGEVRFEPLTDQAILTFGNYAQAFSENPIDREVGFIPYRETAIWIPTVITKASKKCSLPEGSIGYYFPYLWVNEPHALAEGREVYGFRKHWGAVSMPDDPTADDVFSLDVSGFKVEGENTPARRLRLLTISGDTDHKHKPIREFRDALKESANQFKHLIKDAKHFGLGLDLKILASMARAIENRTLPAVSLKQFRDAHQTECACLQQILSFGAHIGKGEFHGAGLLSGKFNIEFEDIASAPVVQDLGLSSNAIQMNSAFWVDMDFEIAPANVVWNNL